MRKLSKAIIIVTPLLVAGAAWAQGGGGGSPTTNAEVAACSQRGTDGKPVRKMSSEEICPMYQFWREDCRRNGELRLVNAGTLGHCSAAAVGMADRDIATGSIR